MRAVLFPGQGSQYVGMGSDFYKKFDSVKKIFNTVDETLGFSLSKLTKLLSATVITSVTVLVLFKSALNIIFNRNVK